MTTLRNRIVGNAVRALALVTVAMLGACTEDTPPLAPEEPLPPGWLAGTVGDDNGLPLSGVRILSGPGGPVAVTGADGAFRIGPFAEGDTVTLTTDSPDTVSSPDARDAWYDFVTAPFMADTAGPVAITLLTRYAIVIEGDASWLPSNDHFSHFLEYSVSAWGASGASISWTWDHYPLAVFIPDSVIVHATAAGDVTIDAGTCARAGLQWWNDAFGRDVLVETTDPEAADVVCAYPVLGSRKVAEAAAVDSLGCGFHSCPPSRVEVRLSSVYIPDETRFTWIAAHEFGHALGFWGHVLGNRRIVEDGEPVLSLMGDGGGTYGYPIHRFEVQAIIARRHIPQGTPLEQYEGTAPWYADFPPQDEGGDAAGGQVR